jgi:hypothetical protein
VKDVGFWPFIENLFLKGHEARRDFSNPLPATKFELSRDGEGAWSHRPWLFGLKSRIDKTAKA